MKMNIKIKICGITNLEDALLASESGADALGFIFASSPRKVEPERVRYIIQHLPPFITTVGVFKDAPLDTVNRIIEICGIDAVQLHGNEPPAYCNQIKRVRLIKRIKIDENSTIERITEIMEEYTVPAYLFDPGEGSGRVFDWNMIKGIKGTIIIGGGLNPENVKMAIKLVKPYGVDVCSGVEKFPGKKDPDRLKAFIKEVRACI
ncbi:MAG: phosphoribosylanthranilate isomerase [candidate division WOR-3 bacterium]|nr:phosphoribosylanthranilate isomerase [candidate division WOR-3 bacterium]